MYVSRLKNRIGVGAFIKIIRPVATNAVPIKINQDTTSAPKPWREIPGPSSLPIIGPILHVLPGGSLYNKAGMEMLDHLYREFGPIVRLDSILGRPNFVFLFDPEASAQVLRSENLMPIRPGFESLEYYRKKHNQTHKYGVTTGLLSDHGENWKTFRSSVNPVMLQPKTVKLYSTVLDEVAQDMITSLSEYFIKKAVKNIEKKNAGSKTSDEEKGVMEKLLEIDEHVAIIMAADMLFAGVDTAANTMLAVFYLLATNPDKQDKLREEVVSGEGKRSYLKACVKESLRLLPVATANVRQTTKEYNLCDYKIPKGTNIIFAHQLMASMEKQFPRPKEFLPERWLMPKDDPLYHGNAHPFAMMPFGFGVRQCIGKRIADLEMETFLYRFIQNFKVEWEGDEPLKVKSTSLTYVVGPYNYVFKDLRNDSM